jgi:DNA-binding protein H-NS
MVIRLQLLSFKERSMRHHFLLFLLVLFAALAPGCRSVGDDSQAFALAQPARVDDIWAAAMLAQSGPVIPLAQSARADDIWAPQSRMPNPMASSNRPSLTTFQNRLYAAWKGVSADEGIYWSSFNGSTWAGQQRIPAPVASSIGPALATMGSRLYAVWKGAGGDQGLYWSSFKGAFWAGQQRIPDPVASSVGPALAELNGRLYAAWKGAGSDQGIYWSTFNGTTWAGQQRIPGPVASSVGPALAELNGRLYAAWKGADTDQGIYWFTFNGTTWAGQQRIPGPVASSVGPALAALSGRIYAAWKGAGADQGIYWSTFDGTTWTAQRRISDPVASSAGPALGVLNGRLYADWKGTGGDHGLYWSSLGPSTSSRSPVRISVITFNLLDGDAKPYANRIAVAAGVLQFDVLRSKGKTWDLIGLNECHTSKATEVGLLGPCGVTRKATIPCKAAGGGQLYTAECFARQMSPNPFPYSQQYGEDGIVARSDRLSPVGGMYGAEIGRCVVNTHRREMVGQRYRINGTNYVVPFYSTHINTHPKVCCEAYRRDSVKDAMNRIQGAWVAGDVVPVLVGDFNDTPTDTPFLSECFVATDPQSPNIDSIWIGKQSCFPNPSALIKVVSHEVFDAVNDGGLNMSDHPAVHAELELVPTNTGTGGSGGLGGSVCTPGYKRCPDGAKCCGSDGPGCCEACVGPHAECP